MTGRVRKPTARALDAAQSRLLEQSIAPERRRAVGVGASSAGPATASAAVKRKGKAVNAKGKAAVARDQARASAVTTDEDPDERDSDQEQQQDDQPDLTLYCVCLGYDTGEQPMIQCEHCSNWFHFGCIGLSDETAAQIEGYACEMCQQMGVGVTRLLPASTAPSSVAPTASDGLDANEPKPRRGRSAKSPAGDDGEEEDDEVDPDDDPMGGDDDDDYEEEGSAAKKRKQAEGRAGRAARRRKIERADDDDQAAEDDDDDESELEDDEGSKSKAKRKPAPNRRTSSTPARPAPTTVKLTSVPQTEKTRAAVVKQFTTTFSSIYSASQAADAQAVASRATAFAEAVEQELFEGFCEADDKGVRGPRAKYTSKFRSLQFNLKTNAVFRSRIANDELSASGIVNISAEDLQTPELKAMAESVRAASLKNSVKEAMAVPTAKRTHKGEEEMENNSARLLAEEEQAMKEMERKRSIGAAADQRERERSGSVPQAGSPFPDLADGSFGGSPAPGTPDPSGQGGDSPSDSFFASRPRQRPSLPSSSSLSYSNHESFAAERSHASPGLDQGSPFAASPPRGGAQSPRAGADEQEGDMSPPPQPRHRNSSTSIDMTAIWGKAKAASPSLEPQDGEAGADEAHEEEAGDMFDFAGSKSAAGQDDDGDDFEDALFRSEGGSPVKKTPRPPPQPVAALPAISDLPPVWAGDVIVPDEGGYPAFGVQVGGRPLGSDHKTWQRILPRTLPTAGRISTQQASKYLVDCSFAPTRELTVVALLPDTTGPSEHFPHKPTGERCIAKHDHIFDHYVKKDRIGVVQPPKELAGVVKDIYLIPLPKEHPLPEYVELLDEHVVPEAGTRDKNLLLCVLVMQKGALPTVKTAPLAPATTSASAASAMSPVPSASPAPAPIDSAPPRAGSGSPYPIAPSASSPPLSTTGQSPLDPSSFQSLLANVDPATLSTILSNPQTLSALTSAQSQASLNTANSQPSLPLSIPTGPRNAGGNGFGASSGGGGGGAGGGPPIHPSRLAAMAPAAGLGGVVDPSAYQGVPTGPRTPTGGLGGQHRGFESQMAGNENSPFGDGGWGGRGGMRGGRGGGGRGTGGFSPGGMTRGGRGRGGYDHGGFGSRGGYGGGRGGY
ncbi:hypothetical protein JCM10212_002590 [Sporobolomyces blumeae]